MVMEIIQDLKFKFRYYELFTYKRVDNIVSLYYEDEFIAYLEVFNTNGKEWICINDTQWNLSAFKCV